MGMLKQYPVIWFDRSVSVDNLHRLLLKITLYYYFSVTQILAVTLVDLFGAENVIRTVLVTCRGCM